LGSGRPKWACNHPKLVWVGPGGVMDRLWGYGAVSDTRKTHFIFSVHLGVVYDP